MLRVSIVQNTALALAARSTSPVLRMWYVSRETLPNLILRNPVHPLVVKGIGKELNDKLIQLHM